MALLVRCETTDTKVLSIASFIFVASVSFQSLSGADDLCQYPCPYYAVCVESLHRNPLPKIHIPCWVQLADFEVLNNIGP